VSTGVVGASGPALGTPVSRRAAAEQSVRAVETDTDSITVEWDDQGATWYGVVWYEEGSGNINGRWAEGTDATVSDLESDTTYVVYVAYDDGGQFAWLGPANVTTEAEDDGNQPDGGDQPDDDSWVARVERAIHSLSNDRRQQNGVGTVEYRTDIAAVARDHSQWMAENNNLTHTRPDGTGPSDRVRNAGIDCWVAENILYNWSADESAESAAETCVNQWMNSSGHRRNILNSGWGSLGVGVATDSQGRIWATQKFGNGDC